MRVAGGSYEHHLNRAVQRPGRVLSISVLLLIGSLALFPFIGVSLFPKAEKPMLLVNIDMPEGSNFDQTDAMTARVEALVGEHPLVEGSAPNSGLGNPREYWAR